MKITNKSLTESAKDYSYVSDRLHETRANVSEQIDDAPAARAHLAIEDVDTDMFLMPQRVCSADHEHGGVHPRNRFL